jgi:hypothetical protein
VKLPLKQLVTIAVTIACLIGVLVMKRRCASSVDGMFRALDQPAPRSSADGG